MGHNITALAIATTYDREVAASYGLVERLASGSLFVFAIDHYWSAYWQAKRGGIDGMLAVDPSLPGIFPTEGVIRTCARELTRLIAPKFAVIQTEYFGGSGEQWAALFEGERTLLFNTSVNEALRALGVMRSEGFDEWDTIGLADYRSNPEHLEKYVELCEQLGV
ncbi:MAG: hypothetical protein H0V17_30960 [Deltaproteobacteria bacterium]|nr:hypothetical protein [Deltaproteobacteria bacterium]